MIMQKNTIDVLDIECCSDHIQNIDHIGGSHHRWMEEEAIRELWLEWKAANNG